MRRKTSSYLRSGGMMREIAGIVKSEEKLISIFDELWQAGFSRYDISVQDESGKLKHFTGESYPNPKKIIGDPQAPRTASPLMPEEFGWELGFSVAFPVVVMMIIGLILGGNIELTQENLFLGGALGALIGAIPGLCWARYLFNKHQTKINQQTQRGGFVIWVKTDTVNQKQQVKTLFKK